jgi:hypothetical protein
VGREEGCSTAMVQGHSENSPLPFSTRCGLAPPILCLAVVAALMFSFRHLQAQDEQLPVDDITAKYHFLSAEDTLAILDQEGKLKGYIEVTQPAEESDDILTYDLVEGLRQKNHVEFRTNRIHGKYYRFSGTAERGKGHEDKDPDYLHLAGSLDVVTVNAETGKESVQVMRLTFKSIGKAERPDE